MTHGILAQIHNPVLPWVIGGTKTGATTDMGGKGLGAIISQLIGALFVAGFLLSFFFLMLGGVSWITSGGDKTKLEKARDQITNAIIGLIIVGGAFAIAALVSQFFGLDLKALPIPTIGQP